MTKLIVIDLDGTLLHSDKSISLYTRDVLKSCQKAGINVAFATARSESSAKKYIGIIKPDIIISNGGATVNYKGTMIYKCKLSVETVQGIISRCLKCTEGYGEITIETDEGYFWNYNEKPSADSDYENAIYTDYNKFMHSAYKITADIANEKDAQNIADCFDECSMLCFTGESWKRFAHKDANKVVAINKLIKYLGIVLEEVIAFGDDYNDIEMIEHCGLGIAMENAIPQVKKVANAITISNDDDGVAKYIEKYIRFR